MNTWIEDTAQIAHTITPTALVGLRTLKEVLYPQQTISAVGVSHLTYRVGVFIGAGPHRQRQEEVRNGLVPPVSPGLSNRLRENL